MDGGDRVLARDAPVGELPRKTTRAEAFAAAEPVEPPVGGGEVAAAEYLAYGDSGARISEKWTTVTVSSSEMSRL